MRYSGIGRCSNDQLAAVRLLLLLGAAATPNAAPRRVRKRISTLTFETPLHTAARLGRRKMVAELLAAGANVTSTDDAGRTAADLIARMEGGGSTVMHTNSK